MTDSEDVPSPAATVDSSENSGSTNNAQEGDNNNNNTSVPMEIEGHAEYENAQEQSLKLKEAGNKELVAGHFLEAIRLYSEALKFTPTSSIILSNRAMAYLKVENYGLAEADATAAIESDPTYAKGYYRRGSAYFALTKFKAARKDFRAVCKLIPKDKDARNKFAECDKRVKEEAFANAIVSEQTAPLSSYYNPNDIPLDTSKYDGPHPGTDGLTGDVEYEASLFEPGNLPRIFVMVSPFIISLFPRSSHSPREEAFINVSPLTDFFVAGFFFLQDAVERFRNQKLIHKRYVARLLIACEKYFEALPSLLDIPIPTDPPEHEPSASPRLTVCGDTHGQYYDVLNIFEMNGYPSANNPYLFNGDFVDRGSFSVEVILTFLLFKIHDPDCIFLTRGNHETKNMNRIYGM